MNRRDSQPPAPRVIAIDQPAMSTISALLLSAIEHATQGYADAGVVYRSEWLGYLPYGAYCWLEFQGADISRALPPDWGLRHLEDLARDGFLHELSRVQHPSDEFDLTVTYAIVRKQ